jgi:hypothetical protein
MEKIKVANKYQKSIDLLNDALGDKRLNPVYISDNQNLTISMVMI